MKKQKVVLSDKLYPARKNRMYAHAIRRGNTIYVTGQTARTKEHMIVHRHDPLGQLEVVFQNMQVILEAAGASMQDVVKLNFYLIDMLDMYEMIPTIRKYFGDHTPARTSVQVSQLAHPNLLIEVDAIAVIGDEEEIIIDGK